MLKNLEIENIAVIEKVSVGFTGGLNVLTGETGAGKSIVIDSINAVMGEKTSRELIRTGEESANVNALFSDISPEIEAELGENGLEASGELLLSRKIFKDGRNACRINGTAVPLSMLRNIAYKLVNIHGQRDSQTLLDSKYHIDFLDEFAGCDALKADYNSVFSELIKTMKEMKRLQKDEAFKAQRTEILTYQINELKSAAVTPGETELLKARKTRLNNAEKLKNALYSALSALTGTDDADGADTAIDTAVKSLAAIKDTLPELDETYSSLAAAGETVRAAAGAVHDALRSADEDEGDINETEERLELLSRLSKKYGETEEDMLGYLANAENELAEITGADEKLAVLNSQYERLLLVSAQKAEMLTEVRKQAGERLSRMIQNELAFLCMPETRFVVSIEEDDLSYTGADKVEFLLSANRGEEPKSLGKVASGGELSRIMLAMKNVLTDSNGADTLIFDEIDSGVSGVAADKIGQKLYAVSGSHQVICITHQAMIAARAQNHILLKKGSDGERTRTTAAVLSADERAAELARITYGENPTPEQLLSSRQLLNL